jgi:hypothetical protein
MENNQVKVTDCKKITYKGLYALKATIIDVGSGVTNFKKGDDILLPVVQNIDVKNYKKVSERVFLLDEDKIIHLNTMDEYEDLKEELGVLTEEELNTLTEEQIKRRSFSNMFGSDNMLVENLSYVGSEMFSTFQVSRVLKIGEDVKKCKVGDIIFSMSTFHFAEFFEGSFKKEKDAIVLEKGISMNEILKARDTFLLEWRYREKAIFNKEKLKDDSVVVTRIDNTDAKYSIATIAWVGSDVRFLNIGDYILFPKQKDGDDDFMKILKYADTEAYATTSPHKGRSFIDYITNVGVRHNSKGEQIVIKKSKYLRSPELGDNAFNGGFGFEYCPEDKKPYIRVMLYEYEYRFIERSFYQNIHLLADVFNKLKRKRCFLVFDEKENYYTLIDNDTTREILSEVISDIDEYKDVLERENKDSQDVIYTCSLLRHHYDHYNPAKGFSFDKEKREFICNTERRY